MIEIDYRAQFHQALAKAFAAQSMDVRNAYFDLATYYRAKLEDPVGAYPLPGGYRSWAAG